MAKVQVTCGIEACDATWSLAPAAMKKTLQEHRERVHPGWLPPEKKAMTPYRLDYSGRGRQF
jgi:hypothetical protein